MDPLSRYHLDGLLGAGLLVFLAYGKWTEIATRRHAVRATGHVVKVFGHRHATSYFIRYPWRGAERTTEWRGAPMRQQFAPGDPIEILVDPGVADVPIPDGTHNAPNAGMGGGGCSLANEPMWSWWDLLYAAAGLALIVRSLR